MSDRPRVLVPAMFPEYVDPGSVVGRYEKTEFGFFGSRLAADCCNDTRGGGPGKISVARAASPSRCGGCTTDTPGNVYTGAPAMEVTVRSGGREEKQQDSYEQYWSWSQVEKRLMVELYKTWN